MKAFVAVTDNDWFEFLASQQDLDEVNFWTPSGKSLASFEVGEPVLFKLHAPLNVIAGGAFFAHFSVLPVSMAWDAFGLKNGARDYDEMRTRVEYYRGVPSNPREDYKVGCVILTDPFFLERAHWFQPPVDFHPNIVRGKSYDLTSVNGRSLWERVLGERALESHALAERGEPPEGPLYGDPTLVKQRLGQGAFRILVTDTYERRCAVTREKALPALQAAHIRPVSAGGRHRVSNGLLFRSDVHALFDRGYVTVSPDLMFRASRRLRDDFDNGEHYLQLAGTKIWLPHDERDQPAREALEWHSDTVFLG
jgi:putative restriction endonuclease